MTETSPSPKKLNQSLLRKRAARLAAAQYGYRKELNPAESIEAYITELRQQWRMNAGEVELDEADDEGDFAASLEHEPDWKLLRQLLEGEAAAGASIDRALTKMLEGKRRPERVSPLLWSILRLAAYELLYFPERKPAVVLSEYVSLTARFFDDPELGFANGILQEVAGRVRDKQASAE